MLDRDAIACRIPHGGRMRLLARVERWDASGIDCRAVSHRDADNPLRVPGGLPAWAGIEYAAQAAAVHGSLLESRVTARGGVLAALKNVTARCRWLDQARDELHVSAALVHRDPAGGIYRFQVGDGQEVLLEGQFTLMFREPGAGSAA